MAKVLVVTGVADYLRNDEIDKTFTKTIRIPLTITFPSLPGLPSLGVPIPPFPTIEPPHPKFTWPKLPTRPNFNIGLPKFGDPAVSGPPPAYTIDETVSSHTE